MAHRGPHWCHMAMLICTLVGVTLSSCYGAGTVYYRVCRTMDLVANGPSCRRSRRLHRSSHPPERPRDRRRPRPAIDRLADSTSPIYITMYEIVLFHTSAFLFFSARGRFSCFRPQGTKWTSVYTTAPAQPGRGPWGVLWTLEAANAGEYQGETFRHHTN